MLGAEQKMKISEQSQFRAADQVFGFLAVPKRSQTRARSGRDQALAS
jgi:hypothetical protein